MQMQNGEIVALVIFLAGVLLMLMYWRRKRSSLQGSSDTQAYKNGLPIIDRSQRQTLTGSVDASYESDDDALEQLAAAAQAASSERADEETPKQLVLNEPDASLSYPVGQSRPLDGIEAGDELTSPMLSQHLQEQQAYHDQGDIASQALDLITIRAYPRNPERVFAGKDIMALMKNYDLKCGAGNAFYRYHEESEAPQDVWCGVLGLVDEELTGFNLNSIHDDSYEGLYFFVQAGSRHFIKGFDFMKFLCDYIKKNWDAVLCDTDGFEWTEERLLATREKLMS